MSVPIVLTAMLGFASPSCPGGRSIILTYLHGNARVLRKCSTPVTNGSHAKSSFAGNPNKSGTVALDTAGAQTCADLFVKTSVDLREL